jgi:hypothetical protein
MRNAAWREKTLLHLHPNSQFDLHYDEALHYDECIVSLRMEFPRLILREERLLVLERRGLFAAVFIAAGYPVACCSRDIDAI